jgi:hypothetical protein
MNNNDTYPDVLDSKDTRKLAFFFHVIKQILWCIAIAANAITFSIIILSTIWLFVSAGLEFVANWLSLN